MAEIDQPLFFNDVISTSSSGVSIETEPLLLAGLVSHPPAWEGAPPLLVDPQRWGIPVSRSGEISVSVVIYVVGGHRPEALGDFEPLSGRTPDGSGEYHVHELTPLDDFRGYEDRLVVDWTTIGAPGPSRSWKQWAGRNPKPVVEITDQTEPPFPGFTTFAHAVDELDLLPRSWREVLRCTCGVYLLTDEDGQQYVGSAKGAEGFLGRWQSYREGRAGGNLGLASHAVGRFRVTVLRTFDPSTPDITIEAEESAWKTKLGSRERGLNRN